MILILFIILFNFSAVRPIKNHEAYFDKPANTNTENRQPEPS